MKDKLIDVVILSAGKGTRLRPLTYFTHKNMIKIANKPFLEWTLLSLSKRRSKINEVRFVVNYKANQIMSYFGSDFGGLDISYRYQKKLDGTASAVLSAGDFEEDIICILGDTFLSVTDFDRLYDDDGDTLLSTEVNDPRNHFSLHYPNFTFAADVLFGTDTVGILVDVDKGLWRLSPKMIHRVKEEYMNRDSSSQQDELGVLECRSKSHLIKKKKNSTQQWIQIGDHEGFKSLRKANKYFNKHGTIYD